MNSDEQTNNTALALSATIPLLNKEASKKALALMLHKTKDMDADIKTRIGITLSSIMPAVANKPDLDSDYDFAYKTLIDIGKDKIKDNIRLSLLGYHYLAKYDSWF